MANKHYPVKNTIGGSFCKKCFNWSSQPDGLIGYECLATREEAKENMKRHKNDDKLRVYN
jgi:hypothetical protein